MDASKKLTIAFFTLILGFGFGYFTSASISRGDSVNELQPHQHDHALNKDEKYVIEYENIPEIKDLQIEKDEASGWNISFETINFKFTPENVNAENIDNEGHAHIYLDGKKIDRLYAPIYHLDELSPGQHIISVTLNTNDHKAYSYEGQVIEATQKINIE